jgi:peptidoglycan/xylan/chitin deacetylase (PgdA/CDA1 family)
MYSPKSVTSTIIKFLLGMIYILLGKPGISKGLTTFVFHDVTDTPSRHSLLTKTYTKEELFRRQIKWISRNFKVLNAQELSNRSLNSGSIITFDDGYKSAILFASRHLLTLNIHSFHFINPTVTKGGVNSTALVHFIAEKNGEKLKWENSNPSYFRNEISKLTSLEKVKLNDFSGPYANQNEIIKSVETGYVTIGNHGNNHWFLNSISKKELMAEMEDSLEFLKAIPNSNKLFSTPHALAGEDSLEAIAQAGYEIIFSGKRHIERSEYLVLPRIDMSVRINNYLLFLGAICLQKLKKLSSVLIA